MDNAELKTMMLDLFHAVRVELDLLIDGLIEEEKNARGSMAEWSAKDMLAHLAFWGSHFNEQIRKAQLGEAVPMAGDYYEILNDGVLLRNLDTPFETARAEEQTAYEETMGILDGIDADDLNDPKFLEFLNSRSLVDRALGTECWHVLAHVSDYYVKKGDMQKRKNCRSATPKSCRTFPVGELTPPTTWPAFTRSTG